LLVGLHVKALLEHYHAHGTLRSFKSGGTVVLDDPQQILEQPCDILVPAAIEQVITGQNAGRIQAAIIAEAANGPTTPEAARILHAKGVVVLPDMLVNAGGVVVSYFEWLKNLSHVRFGRMSKRWEEYSKAALLDIMEQSLGRPLDRELRLQATYGPEEHQLVYSGLEDTMITACEEVRSAATELGSDLRTAALYCAIRKVASATDTSGMIFSK
jgi:glutamate dehydrogenase (NAD(P)+)